MNLGKQNSSSKKYLSITKELFAFADKYRGLYSDSIADANEFYRCFIYFFWCSLSYFSVNFLKICPHFKWRAGENLI